MRSVSTLAVAAALMGAVSGPAMAASAFTPTLTYTADPFAVVGADKDDAATYTHQVVAGGSYALDPKWSLTVLGAWTAGASLSEQAVGDIAGVQGVFNNGDQLWLYQVQVTGTFKQGSITLGRQSAGDAFGALPVMGQFVNSAFSSNGGAISVNDPGRATSPASSWGATGSLTASSAVTLKGGAFLSDPSLFAGGFRGSRLAFKPGRGVLGFAEADIQLKSGWTLGVGGYADSADQPRFSGGTADGTHGVYASLDAALIPGAKTADPPKLEGFVLMQHAPADRSPQPWFTAAGLVLTGPHPARPKDVLAFAVQSGRIARGAGGGRETTLELNYLATLNSQWGVRPTVQYVIGPSGQGGDAWVFGAQLQFGL